MKSNKKDIEYLRNHIDSQDELLFTSLNARLYFVKEIGKIKKNLKLPIEDRNRFDKMVNRMVDKYKNGYLSEELIRKIYDLIHEESIKIQKEE